MKTNKKAISLIVLIITIIVLAILATVIIASIVNTGIINSAKDAVEAQKLGQVRDVASVAWGQALIDKDISTPSEYLNYIINFLKGEGYTDTELDKYTIVADVNGVTVDLKDKDSEEEPPDVTPDNPEPVLPENSLVAMYKAGTLKQGDYVDYTPSPADSYSPDGETLGSLTGLDSQANVSRSQEDLNWRVLGYDENKNELLLISGTPTYAALQFGESIRSYNNFIDVLNNTNAALYGNTDLNARARNINMDDINKYLDGYLFYNDFIESDDYGYSINVTSNYTVDEITGNLVYTEQPSVTNLIHTSYDYYISDYISDSIKINILSGANSDYVYWVATRTTAVSGSAASWYVEWFGCAIDRKYCRCECWPFV